MKLENQGLGNVLTFLSCNIAKNNSDHLTS